jgi:hypothetical protein
MGFMQILTIPSRRCLHPVSRLFKASHKSGYGETARMGFMQILTIPSRRCLHLPNCVSISVFSPFQASHKSRYSETARADFKYEYEYPEYKF